MPKGIPMRGGWKRRLWAGLGIFTILVVLSAYAGAYAAYRHYARDLPSLDALRLYRPKTVSFLYADDGRVIAEYARERRYVVPLERIPNHLILAFLAAEDANFYHHPGVDVSGMVRAFLKNWEAGRIVQGGSTITQQVTRTFLLSNEQTYERKIKEAILAYRMERHLSKEEILFLYLNQIYLGGGAYGVEAAARTFFAKNVENLSLAEAAMMAGLVKAPSRYNPLENLSLARRRQNYVLERMAAAGFVSAEEAARALKEDVSIQSDPNPAAATGFAEQVRRQVVEKLGEDRLYEDGLRIYTTVNPDMQKAALAAVVRGLEELEARHPEADPDLANMSPVQGALVCLDPVSGAVKAMVGGRDPGESDFNRAVQAKRQPGSAFKPFVYAAALAAGYTPADTILDEPVEYEDNGRVWSPQNYDRKFDGPTTLYEGLVRSRNVVTVRLLEKAGLDMVIRYAKAMGIRSHLGRNLSLALGTSEVSLLEMASAYGVIDNGGRCVAPRFITRIEDRDGRELIRFTPRSEVVLDEATAYILLDMMRGVVESGTGGRAAIDGRPLAGKTGTTSDLADAWFIGFSPKLVTGVWVGRDLRERLGDRETGGRAAAPIFKYFMESALAGKPAGEFVPPPGVIFANIDPETGQLADESTEEPVAVCFQIDRIGPSILTEETGDEREKVEHVHLIFRGKTYRSRSSIVKSRPRYGWSSVRSGPVEPEDSEAPPDQKD